MRGRRSPEDGGTGFEIAFDPGADLTQQAEEHVPPLTPETKHYIDVALLVPQHGPAGMFGPSAELCAKLAVEETNAEGGLLGREVRLFPIDSSGPTAGVVKGLVALIAEGRIDAVVGWHLSPLRRALAPIITGRVPYVYTALYEGGEETEGVFLTGEVPDRQLAPAVGWMSARYDTRRWSVVGNDYVWPLATAQRFARFGRAAGSEVISQMFVPLGTEDFSSVLASLEQNKPDATLVLLVGEDAAHFNRAFAARGLEEMSHRLSPLMDENILMASGAGSNHGVHTVSGFFESVATSDNLDFCARYADRFGVGAPMLNSAGESCYEGMRLLAALVNGCQSLNVAKMCEAAETIRYRGPRGELQLKGRHLDQPIYLAEADELDINIITSF